MVTDANNNSTGTIVITNTTDTQKSSNYVKHRFQGTDSKSWSFNWVAPSTDVGTITIYAAGNQANNNGSNSGDTIHTKSLARVAAPTNTDPVISTTSPLSNATEDIAYADTVSASDADGGDVLSYSITSGPSWLSINASTGALSGTPANDDVGEDVAVTIVVTDDASPAGSATLNATITVTNVNDPPVITTTTLDSAAENTAYSFTIDATDPDVGDVLTYNLTDGPSWLLVDSLTGALSGTPETADIAENTPVTILITDNGSPQDSVTLNTAITVLDVNDPPVISTTSLDSATQDVEYSFSVIAADQDSGDAQIFSITDGPAWLSVDSLSGALSGTPANDDVGDNVTVTIIVTDDGTPQESDTLNTAITVINVNDLPVITTVLLPDATESVVYGDTVKASDPDVGDVLTFTITDGPSWLSVDSLTGAFSGTPANEDVGDNVAVTIFVTDDGTPERSDTLNTTITVINVNDPPVITTVSLANAIESVAYDDTVKATDPDAGDTITFVKISGPDWMTVSENGAVGGTPDVFDVGTEIAVSVSVEDVDGAADTLTTSIAVIAKDVVVVADPDMNTDIAIPADGSSVSLDFSNNSSLSIAFTSGEVANQIISVKQVSSDSISTEFPTVPEFTNAINYIDISLDVQNIVAELTFEYDEGTVTGFGLNEDSLVVSVFDSLDSRGFIWHLLPSTVDTDSNTITVTTDHFSLWAIASNTEELITSVDDGMEDETLTIPNQFILEQNYPNPFNPTATIQFILPRSVQVSLKIYNSLGQEVRNLIDTTIPAGENSIIWDGRNSTGQLVSSGLYFMRLQAGEFTDIKRMTFIK